MKNKLIKQYENDTDFSICVWEMKNGYYAVTTYDRVTKKHSDAEYFAFLDWAQERAVERNKEYAI